MTNEQRRAEVEVAIDLVVEAQGIIDGVVEGTSLEGNYRAYGRYGFDRLLGNGNPYDESLESLLTEDE